MAIFLIQKISGPSANLPKLGQRLEKMINYTFLMNESLTNNQWEWSPLVLVEWESMPNMPRGQFGCIILWESVNWSAYENSLLMRLWSQSSVTLIENLSWHRWGSLLQRPHTCKSSPNSTYRQKFSLRVLKLVILNTFYFFQKNKTFVHEWLWSIPHFL